MVENQTFSLQVPAPLLSQVGYLPYDLGLERFLFLFFWGIFWFLHNPRGRTGTQMNQWGSAGLDPSQTFSLIGQKGSVLSPAPAPLPYKCTNHFCSTHVTRYLVQKSFVYLWANLQHLWLAAADSSTCSYWLVFVLEK